MTVTLKKKRRKIWIALPCYGGDIKILTMKSLIHDMFRIIMRGDEVYIFDQLGHADIYLLRAQIVSHFLSDPDGTDLVMIDNDVGWEAHGLEYLLAHDVDLVAGAYPKREDPIKFMFRSAMDNGQGLTGDAGSGLVEVWGMPGGFMRMKRAMLEKMAAAYTDLNSVDTSVPSGMTCRMFDPLWFRGDTGSRVLAEDYAFCQRWRDIGGKVYMDASISMAHIGTKAFVGRLGEFLTTSEQPKAEAAE
jgi:hypothetical protein